MYIDIHTHNEQVVDIQVYQVLLTLENPQPRLPKQGFFAVGIHPKDAAYTSLFSTLERLACDPRCIAIGECGFDHLVSTPPHTQTLCFEHQLSLALRLQKPIFIHCVKGFQELIASLKACPKHPPIIIHGFRGKPQQAQQLLQQGYYLSFGSYYHPQSMLLTPLNRLLLETDESPKSIRAIYQQAANTLDLTLPQLQESIHETVKQVFPRIFTSL